jgi:hypothetical protein
MSESIATICASLSSSPTATESAAALDSPVVVIVVDNDGGEEYSRSATIARSSCTADRASPSSGWVALFCSSSSPLAPFCMQKPHVRPLGHHHQSESRLVGVVPAAGPRAWPRAWP